MMRWLSLERVAVVAMVALPAAAAAQQGTVVTGRVTDQSSGSGIPDARVTVVGTALVTGTDVNGAFTLRNVPTGTQVVRVVRIGFLEQKKTVQVASGTPVSVVFTVAPAAIQLQQVVTTATGVQRSVEVGNSIGQIKASQIVQNAPVTSMGDLLTARTPGVQVLGGTMTGAAPRVRIRGTNSLSLNNDPIYIIDGVRMTSASASGTLSMGGTTLSRVSDINPDEIENIEVVRGPSAATLYGTDAANGVILITTKRGRAGRTAVSFLVENGAAVDKNNYPTAYSLTYGGLQSNGLYGECTLTQVSTNTCLNPATKLPFTPADLTLRTFNPYNDPNTTPNGIGRRQKYGVQASGGSEAVRFFTSLESEHERSPLQVPAFDVARLDSANGGIPAEQFNPNAIRRISARTNLTATFSPQFNIALSAGFINSLQSLPQTDNNTTGLASSSYGGPGYNTNRTSVGVPLFGYRAFTPGDIFQEVFQQGVNRFLGNTTGTWTPLSWFSSQAIGGIDYANIVETDLCRRGQCSDFGTNRLGFKNDFRTSQATYNAKSINTANFKLASFLTSKSTFAAEYLYQLTDENGATANTLAPGTTTVNSGSVLGVDEATTLSRTLGLALEQQFGIRDRLFVTAGVRRDRNSAFGANLTAAYYPKASVSYVISDEGFFPKADWINQVRLRAAVGQSGQRPGTTTALRFFGGNTYNVDGLDQPAIIFAALGNPDLKPETTSETEYGIDSKLFSNKLDIQLTFYNKRTRDALIARILPPSLGAGNVGTGAASNNTRFENIGAVRNRGGEVGVTAQLVDSRPFAWDFNFSGSRNDNTLLALGSAPAVIGATTRQQVGYPLNGYWSRPILSYSDKNGDGIITSNEVVIGDSSVFLGRSIPKYELSFNNGFDLFNKHLRLTAEVDRKSGFLLYNNTERIRCQSRNNCLGLKDKAASFAEQARVVALRDDPSHTVAGFMEDASFWRFRELALTLTPSNSFVARYFRTDHGSLTFSARNLGKHTKYSGVDPESNYSSVDLPQDFQTAAPLTYYIVRLNFGI